jgi:diguanylate cyclase (GGDEF)-like protein
MPHGMCFLWDTRLLTLHVVSDAVIALAYFSIPVFLLAFVRARKDLPFRGLFTMFAVFIVACGATHVLEVVTIWDPIYWVSGAVKAFTAVVSVATAILLIRAAPTLLSMRSRDELDTILEKLAATSAHERETALHAIRMNQLVAMAESLARVGYYRIELPGGAVFWSAEIYRTLGLPITFKPTMEDALQVYHPDERTHVTEVVGAALAAGAPFEMESRVVRPDGEIRRVVWSGQAERAPDESVVAVFGVMQDVTETRALERERERLLVRIRVATEAARVGIWELDLATKVLVWDATLYGLYGVADGAFTPTFERWMAYIHEDDRALVQAYIAESMAGTAATDTEYRITWPDGTLHFIRAVATVVRDASGKPERVIGASWDNTQVQVLASDLRHEKDAATFAADHDALTGLLNRRGLERWIAGQPGIDATLLYLDVDGFKGVNDRSGHDAGDLALQRISGIIDEAVRDGDGTARIGGDEFVVVLRNVRNEATTKNVIDRIRAAVASLTLADEADTAHIGMSIGVGHLAGASSLREALREADRDLYRRKADGRAQASQARHI